MFSFLRPRPTAGCPTVAEIARETAAGRMVLIDVRELNELRLTGKAKGALHIPMGELARRCTPGAAAADIAPGKPVVLYCASGGRSAGAAGMLRRLGYDPVWNLGGLNDWQRGGGTVERV